MGDPTVELLLSRDLDPILTRREASVISDWLENTSKLIYLMRDHEQHNYPILAGMWGLRNSRLKESIGPENVNKLILDTIDLSKQN